MDRHTYSLGGISPVNGDYLGAVVAGDPDSSDVARTKLAPHYNAEGVEIAEYVGNGQINEAVIALAGIMQYTDMLEEGYSEKERIISKFNFDAATLEVNRTLGMRNGAIFIICALNSAPTFDEFARTMATFRKSS